MKNKGKLPSSESETFPWSGHGLFERNSMPFLSFFPTQKYYAKLIFLMIKFDTTFTMNNYSFKNHTFPKYRQQQGLVIYLSFPGTVNDGSITQSAQ